MRRRTLPRRIFCFLLPLVAAAEVSCAQQIATLDPLFRLTTDPSFTLTVIGSSFTPSSIVRWESTSLATTFVSSGQLTAYVPASLYQYVLDGQFFNITVLNPGGRLSNVFRFQVIEPFRITTLSPAAAVAGGPQFVLTVVGSHFLPNHQVLWNSAPLATTYVSRQQLTAIVPAALIANPGVAKISVLDPGHGTAVPLDFNIGPALPPGLTSLSPSTASVGAAQLTLTVNGVNFAPGAQVRWNATTLSTTFVSSTQLTVLVPAALLAVSGVANITVANAAGPPSNVLSFTVACSYALAAVTPAGGGTSAVLPASGGVAVVAVSTGPGCPWSASSNAPWLVIRTGVSGSGNGTVTCAAEVNTGLARVAVLTVAGQSFTVTQQAPRPEIAPGRGVVNGASLEPGLASGAWITLFGINLAGGTRGWTDLDIAGGRLPIELDGVRVNVNGRPAYVAYISPGQINALAPDDPAEGLVLVEVVTPLGKSDPVTVRKQKVAPALFTLPVPGTRYVAAVFSDGTLVGREELFQGAVATRPAKPGEVVALYATGLGPTEPAYPAGQVIRQPAPLREELSVQIGGLTAVVEFAGLVAPGLYQINVRIPDAPEGDALLELRTAGSASQSGVYITVQN